MNVNDKPLVWLRGEVKSPPIGPRRYELRVNDENKTWRIIYRIDPDAMVICEVFEKKAPRTPKSVIDVCQQRLRRYDADVEEGIGAYG